MIWLTKANNNGEHLLHKKFPFNYFIYHKQLLKCLLYFCVQILCVYKKLCECIYSLSGREVLRCT